MRSPDDKQLFLQVRKILLEIWDPIGVGGIAPDDEYDSYVWPIVRMLREGTDRERLIAYLDDIVSDRVGLGHDEIGSGATAQALLALPAQRS